MAFAAAGPHVTHVRSPLSLGWIPLACALLAPTAAAACPDCPEGVRKQVRAGIFDDSFARNLALTALPFGVLASLLGAMALGNRGRDA